MKKTLFITDPLNEIASFNARLAPLSGLPGNSQKLDKLFRSDKKNRAHISPKQIRPCYIFAPETLSWLRSCAIGACSQAAKIKTVSYAVPVLGITNRPLPGYRQAGLNFFRTIVTVNTKANCTNLDQCAIDFDQRLPINAQDFFEEARRQIHLTSTRVSTKGRLTFYCPNPESTPLTTDLETLRLSIIKSMPILNIDWLDPSLSWEALWNPCANLAPIKSKLEDKLIKFLDSLVEQICASQCNVLLQRRDCFFDSVYLKHRKKERLPDLNKIIFTPKADMQNNRILDLFKAEKNLFSYVSQKSHNKNGAYKADSYLIEPDENSGWLPVNI